MSVPSIKYLVIREVRAWLNDRVHKMGDINDAAKRVITGCPQWPISVDNVVLMLNDKINEYLVPESVEEKQDQLIHNKLDCLANMYQRR